MIHLPTATASGTSFHGTTFKASPNQLIESLGEMTSHKSGDSKTSMEWVRELNDAEVFTVYDWKYYREIDMDEVIEWNVGGRSSRVTEKAKEEILTLLNK